MIRRTLFSMVIVTALALPLHSQSVVPTSLTLVDGDNSQHWPWGCALGGLSAMRYQQLYLGSEVGSGLITEIAFRQDGSVGSSFGPVTLTGLSVSLSSTDTAVDAISQTFADNIGLDVLEVFGGDLELVSAPSGANPKPFDVVVPLQAPFFFDAGSGLNLLVDLTIPDCQMATFFDAENSSGDSIARAVVGDNIGNAMADFTDTNGLVTEFNFDDGPSGTDDLVVPVANEALEGNTQNTSPLGCQPHPGMRWQQVYAASEFAGPISIGEIRFRQDFDFGFAFGPLVYPDVEIMLSSGAPDPDMLSAVFAENLGADATLVFDQAVILQSAASTAEPRPFDVVFPLTRSFPYDPSDGNLLLDLRIDGCPIGSIGLWFDAVFSDTDSVSRAQAFTPDATIAETVDTAGMVTLFRASDIFADGFESGDVGVWE